MPRKVFVAGEILTAADVNTNLADQAVMTFAGTAARGSAIGTAVEGMVTYLEDTDQLEVYGGTAVGWTSASNFLFGTATPTDGQVVSYSTAVSGYVPADAATGGGAARNLVYNGAMQVAQRGTSETGITSSSYYTADRWKTSVGYSTLSQTIEADGPTGSGFTKSLKTEVTSSASPAAGNILIVEQLLEGQDLQGLKKGTSNAESLTLSFWVKSNSTGTYICEIRDIDNSRSISSAYTISSADTWEKKTLTIAGDTTGALDNDNANSVRVHFWLGAGSDYTTGTLQTTWGTLTSANRAVGQTNLAASNGNYWQVTGVQLETGTVATGFDHKPYGVELAECQRYYQLLGKTSDAFEPFGPGIAPLTSQIQIPLSLPTEMRAAPSFSSSGNFRFRGASVITSVTLVTGNSSLQSPTIISSQTVSAGDAFIFQRNNDTTAVLEFDAEL